MQWWIDLFFNYIYKVICIFINILFRHVLWYPLMVLYYFIRFLDKLTFIIIVILHYEEFLKTPKLYFKIISTFIKDFFLSIFSSLPRISFFMVIRWQLEKIFHKWCKINSNMYVSLKNFFLNKQKILLFFIFITLKNSKKLCTRIKMILLHFFFYDILQKKQNLYEYFVLFRTILFKITLIYYLFSNPFLNRLCRLIFFLVLGLSYTVLNFDWSIHTNDVYPYSILFLFYYSVLYITLLLIYTFLCTHVNLLNLSEFFIFFNLNSLDKYYYSSYDKAYLTYNTTNLFNKFEQLKDFIFMCIYDYTSTPVFFFFGFLFFTTVLISWIFFGFLSLNGLFKLNLISLTLFWFSLLFYIKPMFLFNKIYNIKISNWFYIGNNTFVDFYFLIDSIAFSFILLTVTIALFVYIYAFSYFRYEPLVDRFLLFLLSFIVSMLFLVSAGNLIMLFLGWELIGLTSFFLINFWVAKTATLKSAFKAFSFNKVSDFFLFIFVICAYNLYFTVDISTLNNLVHKTQHNFVFLNGFSINSVEFLSFFLLASAFIKSAQIGGHIWLPDSMEAPVPASALIHSATLVSAGIYLLLRFNFLFDYSHNFKIIAPLLGSLTAAYGGICAVFQTDLKKTLAYSTISHCGFLVTLCSFELNEFVILYLYVHGFFKAILFMCIGNVLRISMNYQDSRRMGGLFKYLPFEYFCSLVCVFNLAGLPFTFGFFVKHLLFLNLVEHIYLYYYIMFNLFFGAITGLYYSYNILYSIFFDFKKGDKLLYTQLNKKKNFSVFYTNSSLGSTVSIFLLLIFSFMLVFFICKNFLSANFLFSDYVNTIYNSNYYSFVILCLGFNMNFIYINFIVLLVGIHLIYRKKRKIMYVYTQHNLFFSYIVLTSLLLVFYY